MQNNENRKHFGVLHILAAICVIQIAISLFHIAQVQAARSHLFYLAVAGIFLYAIVGVIRYLHREEKRITD